MKKKKDNEKQFENELLKLKLIAEHGGKFHSNDEIPPDVENAFLKNVLAFEENYNKGTSQKVFEILGKPKINPSEELSDEDLEKELENLFKLMEENQISLSFLAEYPTKVKYDFIVNELFDYEVMPGPLPGMTSCFTYEEFHPNAEYSIKESVHDLIHDLFERKLSEFSKLNNKIVFGGKDYEQEEFIAFFNDMFADYRRLVVSEVEISNITKGENLTGSCNVAVKLEETPKDNMPREIRFSMSFSDEYECDWWGLNRLEMEVVK